MRSLDFGNSPFRLWVHSALASLVAQSTLVDPVDPGTQLDPLALWNNRSSCVTDAYYNQITSSRKWSAIIVEYTNDPKNTIWIWPLNCGTQNLSWTTVPVTLRSLGTWQSWRSVRWLTLGAFVSFYSWWTCRTLSTRLSIKQVKIQRELALQWTQYQFYEEKVI
jgi:hypothetical protein